MARIPRLTPTWRKAVLVLHIAGGVGWMGLDAGLLILATTGLTTDTGRTAASCYMAIGLVVPPAVLTLSLIMLASGLTLGMGTKWGLIRYWWVLVKLILGLVLTGLVFFALLPATVALPEAVVRATAAALLFVRPSARPRSSSCSRPSCHFLRSALPLSCPSSNRGAKCKGLPPNARAPARSGRRPVSMPLKPV
jgi:hypothetical protein